MSALRLSGIVGGAAGRLRVRNRIYQRVFDRNWVIANLPDAEVRRQRAAFRRGVVRALAIGMAGLIVLLVAVTYQRTLNQSARLADGTTVVLRKVTYGKQHRFERGPLKLAWLCDLIPRLKVWIPPAFTHPTSVDSLVFWIVRRDSSGHYLGMEWWGDYVALDEHGCEFGHGSRREYFSSSASYGVIVTSGHGRLDGSPPVAGQFVAGYGTLSAFPRRSRSFKLRLLDHSGKAVAEFAIPAPPLKVAPVWIPEPMSATRQAGNLSITLAQLTRELVPAGMAGEKVLRQVAYTPTFQITENGQPTEEWEARQIMFADSAGNSSESSTETLCPYESAWKIRGEFFRKDSARFASNEVWTIRGISGLKPHTAAPLNMTNTIQGVKFHLLGVGGPGRVSYGSSSPVPLSTTGENFKQLRQGVRGSETRGDKPHIALRVSGLTGRQQLLFRCVDDQGRLLSIMEGGASSGDNQFRWFDPFPDSQTIDLTLGVHTGHEVEFIVRPPLPDK